MLRHNPIFFESSPFFAFELTGLSRLAFQVADDPFYKSMKAKFYPEVLVINMKGKVKARVNPSEKSFMRNGQTALTFEDDIREPKLKLNDDRRVNINLGALGPKLKAPEKKPGAASASSLGKPSTNGKMILLTVKINEAAKKSGPEFDRAWYRLVNSDTSQTLDYKKFKEINSPDTPA